jgi:hypothetical protein
VRGSIIHKSRQELADQAEAQQADYTLWIDSDMRFPRDALVRLLSREQDIVGVNYVTRTKPMRYTAVERITEDGVFHLPTGPEAAGLEEAEAIGFGMVLIHGSVWAALGERPWFRFEHDEMLGVPVGEDVYFCRRARAAGFKVMVDHDLSHEIRHIGQWGFRIGHLHMLEEAAEATGGGSDD